MFKLIAFLIFFRIDSYAQEFIFITAHSGQFKGEVKNTSENHQVAIFNSVPYAQSPGQRPGTQRFNRPEPLSPTGVPYDSTVLKPPCARLSAVEGGKTFDETSSEDCLYLTIVSPSTSNQSCCSAVVFWVQDPSSDHFGIETADQLVILAENLSHGNLIFVFVNYRHGPFGFFTTGESDAIGNYGLWDILEALKFTKANIKSFGGDPELICLMGHGFGAVMADLTSLSPLSVGLYSSLILMDGSAFDPAVMKNQNVILSRSARLAYILGCDDAVTNLWNGGLRSQVVECLRTGPNSATGSIASTIGLTDMDSEDPASHFHEFYWRPRIDGFLGILPENIEKLARKRPLVPVLMGISKENWSREILPINFTNPNLSLTTFGDFSALNDTGLVNKTCFSLLTEQIFGENQVEEYRRLCALKFNRFFEKNRDEQENDFLWLHRAVRTGTSLHYMAPLCKSASFMRIQGNWAVYLYSFDYRRIGWYGSAIGAYRNFDFELAISGNEVNLSSNDHLIKNMLAEILLNFAKNRNPIGLGSKIAQWSPYGGANCFLSISQQPTMKIGYFADECSFWINTGALDL